MFYGTIFFTNLFGQMEPYSIHPSAVLAEKAGFEPAIPF